MSSNPELNETLERLIPLLAGRYDIERELGRGGMATVFLARDPRHDREVAIKVLHPELAATIGSERFEREIRLAAKLQHPHILGLYDSGTGGGLFYYVMPYVRGESLRDRLERDGQLAVDDAVQIALEVADALGYAHEQGIVHRDIKPENILLANGHALVADFGIARAATQAGAQKLTQTGLALGTPVYMSPEQASGEGVGPAADIYSLGCVLFEMLAGEPPFTGKNSMAIMARHAMDTVPSVRIVRPAVAEEVEEAIYASMEKSPADRPKNAAAFAAILGMPLGATATRRVTSRYTAQRRVITPPAGEEPPAQWWRKPWVGVAIVALVVAGSLGTWKLVANSRNAAAAGLADSALPQTRVAVLYFTDESRDKGMRFLADGLTESLIEELSPVRPLEVISKNGVAPFRDDDVPRDSIARALGAGTLIQGSVEPAGTDRVRVTVHLVDGRSGADFEKASFEGRASDPLAMRSKLVNQAATLLRSQLGQAIRLRELREGTRNSDAWSLVQRAENIRKDAERAAGDTNRAPADTLFLRADSLLVRAGGIDGAWSEPLTLRSVVAYRRSLIAKPLDAAALIDSGIAYATRAIALSPNDAAPHESRGVLKYRTVLAGLATEPGKTERLVDEAEADLERAVTLDETRASAWVGLSQLYYRKYNITEAYNAASNAYKADTYLSSASDVLYRLFATSYDLENFLPALQWCEKGRQRFPNESRFARCMLLTMMTSARNPDVAEAWRLVDTIVAKSPANRREFNRKDAQMITAVVLGRAGLVDSAKRVLVRARADREIDSRGELQGWEAMARTQIGDKDEAFALLDRYLTANPEHRPGFGKLNNWMWRSLKSDPRYARIIGPGR